MTKQKKRNPRLQVKFERVDIMRIIAAFSVEKFNLIRDLTLNLLKK